MKYRFIIAPLCALALLFSGCAVAPDSDLPGGSSSAAESSLSEPASGSTTSPSDSVPAFVLAPTPEDDANQNDSQGSDDPIDSPGTLQDPSKFRKPDQTDVGKTVKLSAEIMMNIQPDSVERTFVYVYHPAKQEGRLLLFSTPSLTQAYTTVTVFAPEFVGGSGLCEAMKGEFTAQITDILNISYQEGYYIRNISYYSKENFDKMNSGEVVDVNSFSGGNTDAEIQYYFGWLTANAEKNASMQEIAPGISVYLTANLALEQSESIQTSITVFSEIVERFELQNALGL